MSSDNDKMTVVILFRYVIDYVILTTVGQFKHGIAIALANAFERQNTGNHFGLLLSTVCVIGIYLCHLTSILT